MATAAKCCALSPKSLFSHRPSYNGSFATMSRVAKQPVPLPQGVTATISADAITVKGSKGSMSLPLHSQHVKVLQEGNALKIQKANDGREADMIAGSTRAHLAN